MKLDEVYDSDIPDLLYPVGWGWQGIFKWGEQQFTVQLSKIAPPAVKFTRAYEVSFFRSDIKGDDAYSSHDGQEEVPVKVYGVVLNSVRRVWREEDIEALFFTAEPRHSKNSDQRDRKERIYGMLAHRMFRSEGGFLYVHRGDGKINATEWLIAKKELPPNDYWTDSMQEGINEMLASGYVIKSI